MFSLSHVLRPLPGQEGTNHQLDLVDTEGVEPTYRVVDLANIFREDIARGSLTQDEALFNAPRRENGYFKSPRIV